VLLATESACARKGSENGKEGTSREELIVDPIEGRGAGKNFRAKEEKRADGGGHV